MLEREDTVLVLIDAQEKLMRVMPNRDALAANLEILVRGAQALGVPVLWLEQNPAGLGPTVPEVARCLEGLAPIEKISFSACGESRFVEAFEAAGRGTALLCGIETHVCVYQTARDLLAMGRRVEVAADAVASRAPENKATALRRMESDGAKLTSVEMALFELLRAAEGEEFKTILKLVK